ncbi:MAG: phage major tail tube protein [Alphaproteobacteria bacterium]|nr:MAG: phage major tail tube protein [Alphaproteobacteria bacterium]
MQLDQLVNANVYLNGANLLGKAKSIDLGEVGIETTDDARLGVYSKITTPVGLTPPEVTITFTTFDAAVMAACDPRKSVTLQVRANQERYSQGGLVEEVPVVVMLTVMPTSIPLGSFAAQEPVEREQSFVAHYVKVTVGGTEHLEFDAFNNIWRRMGEDVFANFRTNIGG